MATKKKAKVSILEDTGDSKKLVVDSSIDKAEYERQAIDNPEVLAVLIDALCGENRRTRQFAATIVAGIARTNPEVLVEYVPNIVDALNRPEAQTRWEALDALYELVPLALPACKKAYDGADAALYDEESGPVRLAAFRFLCRLGAQDSRTSKKVWPSLDEAIQCYHGDIEFPDMLSELLMFARGSIEKNVKKQLSVRMEFDAQGSKGPYKNKATAIIEACK